MAKLPKITPATKLPPNTSMSSIGLKSATLHSITKAHGPKRLQSARTPKPHLSRCLFPSFGHDFFWGFLSVNNYE